MDLIQALMTSLAPSVLLFNILGTALGIAIGALPGLTATMGVALAVPLTFGMNPAAGLAMLGGIYCGAVYGGSISAILINTPGTPSGAATVLDGYPMAQKGKAIEALGFATISSFIGGIFSVVVLSVAAPALAKVALEFGPAEYFGVMVFGITIVSSISANNLIKGLLAGVLGMFLGTIGYDPITAYPRFAENINGLFGGFAIVPALIGLFSVSQVLIMISEKRNSETSIGKLLGHIPTLSQLKHFIPSFIRSSVIGTFVGILPGAGSSIAAFMSYNEAMRFSKKKDQFGTGIPDGVVASETANNAVTGGSLVPLLTLGIPGNAVSAVFLGALTIQGLKPGPFLFIDQAPLMYSLFISLAIANLTFLVMGLSCVRIFPKILRISPTILSVVIILLGTVGSFAVRNEFFDVWAVFIFGIIGYILRRSKIPTGPVVLGLILGPMIESNFKQAMLISDGNLMTFVAKPICLVFLILALLSFFTPIIMELKRKAKTGSAA